MFVVKQMSMIGHSNFEPAIVVTVVTEINCSKKYDTKYYMNFRVSLKVYLKKSYLLMCQNSNRIVTPSSRGGCRGY